MFQNREGLSFNFGQSEIFSNLGLSLRYRTKRETGRLFQKKNFTDSESTRKMRDKVFKKCDKIFFPRPPPTLPRVKTQEFLNLIYSWGFFGGGDYLNLIPRLATLAPPPPSIGLKMNSGTKVFDCERSERVIGEQREA